MARRSRFTRRRHRVWSAAALVGLGAIVSACSTSAPTPTSPSHSSSPSPASLTIAGTTVIATGATSQLIAKDVSGNVAANVTWQSQTPSIAAVSSSGVVTGIGAGTATITATSAGGAGDVTITVQAPGSSTVTLIACGTITAPGHYIVGKDLVGAPCITVSNVAGVQIDCAGHATGPIVLTNVSNASVANCVVNGNVKLTTTTSVTVMGCTVSDGILWAVTSTSVTFLANTTVIHGTGLGGAIVLDGGSNNRAAQNTMDGGYDGGRMAVGADDGVIVTNESGDTIENNTIRNFFDAGIEGVDVVANTTIANNTISNVGSAGISSYWCTNWTNDVVRGNHTSASPVLFWVFYTTPTHCELPITPAAFTGNQIIGNVFTDPAQGTLSSSGPRARMSVVMSGSVQSNLVQNNDFGSNDGPFLLPLSGFMDGGGNICGSTSPGLSNFPCSGGGLYRAAAER